MSRQARITLTNETDERMFSEWTEPIPDDLTIGDVYRYARAEWGACRSSVYVDQPEGPPKRIGWFFVARDRYSDTGEPYLRGAWVVVEEVEPPRPVNVGRTR